MKDMNFNPKPVVKKYNILDKMYDNAIRKNLMSIDEDYECRLETYNIIMSELRNEGNYINYDEIKYRITDGENVNEVFYDIINRGDYSSPLIWIMRRRVEGYLEEDSYRRFYE